MIALDLLKGALIAALALVPFIYVTRKWRTAPPGARAFVLWNNVTHSRTLPKESAHRFSYHTISLLVSLGALETHDLDLWGGWLFGYGSVFNICGLRPSAYLTPSEDPRKTIRCKLDEVLVERGWDSRGVEEVWFATMPSFLAFEGLNPLSVYYLYKSIPKQDSSETHQGGTVSRSLWLVVLEVHNTFAEKHVYVLETGDTEEPRTSGSTFDHEWVFPRQFHVSPFNDRSGYYRCRIRSIRPPSQASYSQPLPYVMLDVLTDTEPRNTKLTASIRGLSSSALSPKSLIRQLTFAPLPLLSTYARVSYQAVLLHFKRRLDVFPRPEPVSKLGEHEEALGQDSNPVQTPLRPISGSIGYQNSSTIERWAARRTLRFLQLKTEQSNRRVIIISSHPAVLSYTSSSAADKVASPPLTILVRSPAFFTTLLLAPSPLHALLLGSKAEKLVSVSSKEDFLEVFSPFPRAVRPSYWLRELLLNCAQQLRLRLVPLHVLDEHPLPPVSYSTNPLDGVGPSAPIFLAILGLFLLQRVERIVFEISGARFVSGLEPWNGWKRLESIDPRAAVGGLGSVRRSSSP